MDYLSWKISGYFYIFLMGLVQTSAFIPVEDNNTTEYVSGAHVEILPDPLLYDIYVPVIYEIDLPSWNSTDLQVQWPENHSISCESDTWGDNWTQMACPVVYHMNNVTEHFIKNIMDWKDFNSSGKSDSIRLQSCHEIMPHFYSYFLGHEEKDEYLHEDLKNCPLGQVIYEKLSVPWKEVNGSVYTTMLSRFIEENTEMHRYRVSGFTRYATTTNAFAALQTAELLDYIYTNSKWSQAMESCSAENIPYTLVPKETLSTSLKEIERTITSKDNYELTISADDFSKYYKIPIADCTFTTKNTLLVRILVPLRKTTHNYKLALVRSIPFLRHYENSSEICEYLNANEPVLIEQNTGVVISTECMSDELCILPDLASRPITDYCLSALVNNLSAHILEFCLIQCSHFETQHLPYFRRLSTSKYAVLGKSNMEIFVSCDTQPFKVLDPPMPIGALEITLPCPCQLVHRRDSLHSMAPCGNELIIRNIMPIAWTPAHFENSFIEHFHENEEFHEIPELMQKPQVPAASSYNAELLILSLIVVFLFCSNVLLMFVVTKLYKRISRLELCNSRSQGVDNFYETPLPMFVRANDD